MKARKMEINRSIRIPLAIVLMGAAVSISGCGKVAYRDGEPNGVTSQSVSGPGTSFDNSSLPPIPDSTPNSAPAYHWNFTLQGHGIPQSEWTSPAIQTDNTLKVTVHAGQSLRAVLSTLSNSNYTVEYTCEKITITVNGHSESVLVTNNPAFQRPGMPCYGKTESATVDFSDDLTPGQSEVHVKLSEPEFDNCSYICQIGCGYTYIQSAGCQLNEPYALLNQTTNTWSLHQLQGKVEMRVNEY